jgi:hypothetical protein
MKNKLKFLGIIALAAVIGLGFFSCGEAEETEMKITVSGLSSYNGDYGAVWLVRPANIATFWTSSDLPDAGTYPAAISGGSVTLALLDMDERPLVGKSGSYVVIFFLSDDAAGEDIFYVGASDLTGTSISNSTTSIAFSSFTDYTAILFGSSPDGTESNPYPLTAGEWSWDDDAEDDFYVTAVGTTSSDVTTGVIWFSFDVDQGTVYNVFWDDAYADASGQCDADICVAAKYEGDATFTIFGAGPASQNGSSSSNRGVDTAYTVAAIGTANGGRTFTASKDGTVLLRVLPETANIAGTGTRSGAVPGNFAIVYTTGSGIKPRITFPIGANVLQGIKY